MHAQDTLKTRYGVFGHGLVAIHTANFPWLPQTQSCCSGFTGGTNFGERAGFLLEVPIAEHLLVGMRLSLMNRTFSMTTREPIDNIIVNGVGQKGAFEHRLDGAFTTLNLEPMVSYRLFGTFFLSAGISIEKTVSSNYKQFQQISEPSGVGTFLDSNGNDSHKRTRNEFLGKLPHPSLILSPLFAASIELPLNKKRTLFLVPEVFCQIAIMNILSDVDWKVHTLQMGISLKYSPQNDPKLPTQIQDTTKEEPPPVIVQSTPVIEKNIVEKPKVSIAAVGVETTGREVPNPILKIEEFTSTIMTSLLNYIFFKPNSSDIQPRYKRLSGTQTTDFTPEKVNSPNKLFTYYHLLNIIGKRMQLSPLSTITLTGCINDYAEEKSNLALAKKRAESIKDYLTTIWKITPNRIIVEQRLLPAKPSNILTNDGAEENRRVEITTNDENLLAPIVTNDTLRTTNYPIIRFKPLVSDNSAKREWTVTIEQHSTTIKEFSGMGTPPATIDWQLSGEKSTIPHYSDPVKFSLLQKDSANVEVKSSGEIQIDVVSLSKKRVEKRGDKEIDLYSLILFGVKSADITPNNKSIIQFIKKRIKSNAKVVVMGYTDRVGEIGFNVSLADSRAKSVAAFLGKSFDVATIAKGNSNLYDNDLPEGRFYSRTVEIEVQTPVSY
jgi:outer membrane protein OmpA-like peptidoglycan-associated protein